MKNRYRRKVEIYFVLYLAALIFLLPDKKGNEIDIAENGSTIYNEYFTLIPERTVMNCSFNKDSSGVNINSIDSINAVYYTGNIQNVHFEFVIKDQSFNQTLILNTSEKLNSQHFSIIENEEKQAADFIWKPSFSGLNNKTYVVTVYATGIKLLKNEKDKPISIPVKAKTQFTLNLVFLDRTTDQNLMAGNITDTNSTISAIPSSSLNTPFDIARLSSDFNLHPEKLEIDKLAYQNWTNTIYANNINLLTDIRSNIKMEVVRSDQDNGGSATISDVFSDRLILAGKTPFFGSMKVNLSITRKYDDRTYKISFNIKPKMIEQPDFPKIMYPDQFYTIDPKLPIIDSDIKAIVKDDNSVRARSIEGEKFSFTPDRTDIGKTLILERYVSGELFGQSYKIFVQDYPKPEIWDIRRVGDNEVVVTTRAYGSYQGKRNEVAKFQVSGNAKYEDKRGKLNSQDPFILIQYFTFTPKDEDKPFSFKIKAKDKRGKISNSDNYSSNEK